MLKQSIEASKLMKSTTVGQPDIKNIARENNLNPAAQKQLIANLELWEKLTGEKVSPKIFLVKNNIVGTWLVLTTMQTEKLAETYKQAKSEYKNTVIDPTIFIASEPGVYSVQIRILGYPYAKKLLQDPSKGKDFQTDLLNLTSPRKSKN